MSNNANQTSQLSHIKLINLVEGYTSPEDFTKNQLKEIAVVARQCVEQIDLHRDDEYGHSFVDELQALQHTAVAMDMHDVEEEMRDWLINIDDGDYDESMYPDLIGEVCDFVDWIEEQIDA